jgi:hypothetical protein
MIRLTAMEQLPPGVGCSSIVQDPYLKKESPNTRAIIRIFDMSVRLVVAKDELYFSVPMKKFIIVVGNMEHSFLATHSWKTLQNRII